MTQQMNWRAVIKELRAHQQDVYSTYEIIRVLANALEKGLEFKTIRHNQQEITDD